MTFGVFDMRFRDEIARTGATTPLGYDIRANVGRSYRQGIELDGRWSLTSVFDLGFGASVSRNRIRSYRDESTGTTYRDIEPILTPAVTLTHRLTWHPTSRLDFSADGRYQGRTFLAPTGDARLTTHPFYVMDGGAVLRIGERSLALQVRNLLDRRAYPSGDVSDGIARYFILAPRSVDVTVRLTR
jgi:iron complex outermembrane receptor protein